MGTHHLICVFYQGRFVLSYYGQWDGYPQGQGAKVFEFLSGSTNTENLKSGLQHVYEASKEEIYTVQNRISNLCGDKRERWYNILLDPMPMLKDEVIDEFCPSLSADTGAIVLDIISRAKPDKEVPIKLDLSYANNWFFEYGYAIDPGKDV